MKTTMTLLLLCFMTTAALAKEKNRKVASSQTIEIESYTGKPIVFASVPGANEPLDVPESSVIDDKAEWVCKALGYKHDRGNYTLNPMHDRRNRGAVTIFQLMKDGSFKKVQASKSFSFKSVICEAPLEPTCIQDHFGKTDVRFILFSRDDCK